LHFFLPPAADLFFGRFFGSKSPFLWSPGGEIRFRHPHAYFFCQLLCKAVSQNRGRAPNCIFSIQFFVLGFFKFSFFSPLFLRWAPFVSFSLSTPPFIQGTSPPPQNNYCFFSPLTRLRYHPSVNSQLSLFFPFHSPFLISLLVPPKVAGSPFRTVPNLFLFFRWQQFPSFFILDWAGPFCHKGKTFFFLFTDASFRTAFSLVPIRLLSFFFQTFLFADIVPPNLRLPPFSPPGHASQGRDHAPFLKSSLPASRSI